jgi:succinyl-diaminopimelate desuccinylase
VQASARSALLQTVESHRQAMIAWTQKLVAIPTENPPGNRYSQAAQNIREHLVEIGFDDASFIGDCVTAFAGEGERTLYFSGHYDVVPAQNAAQFNPQLKGANLFGRGSADMKGGLAAMTYAAKALRDCAIPLDGRIGLVFVPDEETAGPRGSRDLLARGLLGENAIGMLTPEPTGDVIWNANRGAITLLVTIQGKAAHVGRQFAGVNAFEQMLRVCEALMRLKNEVETRMTGYRIAPAAARRSILMMGGQAEGGRNFNVVPEVCSFTIDRRINPEEDFHEEKRRLLAVLEQGRASGIDLQVTILQEGGSAGVPEDASLGATLARNIREVTGREAGFEMCPGLLEIRFYAERGIPALAYGPGLLTVAHGPNEFVAVDRIVECAAVYALTAADALSAAAVL